MARANPASIQDLVPSPTSLSPSPHTSTLAIRACPAVPSPTTTSQTTKTAAAPPPATTRTALATLTAATTGETSVPPTGVAAALVAPFGANRIAEKPRLDEVRFCGGMTRRGADEGGCRV